MVERLSPYPAYKPSGVEWLGDVLAHWEVRPIKRWLVVNQSVLPDDTDPDHVLEYLEVGSVGTGKLVTPPERIRFGDAPSRARRVVRTGDTIISTVRTYLKAVWHAERAAPRLIASTGFAVLTPRYGTSPKFVSYTCQSQPLTDQVTANSVGVAYPAIAESSLGTLKVAVPSLKEQVGIARFLDHATSRIDRYIRAKQRLFGSTKSSVGGGSGLLGEYRDRLISDIVTGKLDTREATAALQVENDNASAEGGSK